MEPTSSTSSSSFTSFYPDDYISTSGSLSPLVFVVSAIITNDTATNIAATNETNNNNNNTTDPIYERFLQVITDTTTTTTTSNAPINTSTSTTSSNNNTNTNTTTGSRKVSLFDEDDDVDGNNNNNNTTAIQEDTINNDNVHNDDDDDDEYSEEEEDEVLLDRLNGGIRHRNARSTTTTTNKKSKHRSSFGFGRRNNTNNTTIFDSSHQQQTYNHYHSSSSHTNNSNNDTSFARLLNRNSSNNINDMMKNNSNNLASTNGASSSISMSSSSFISKGGVRMINISTRYGFPPSKDPDGIQNIAYTLSSVVQSIVATTSSSSKSSIQQQRPTINNNKGIMIDQEQQVVLQSIFDTYPITGIIPIGWLGKQLHALPSTIVVVCTITSNQKEQRIQDTKLYETIQHLQYSIIPKRQCCIIIVGIMYDNVTNEQGIEWSKAITQDLVLEENLNNTSNSNTTPFITVTLLRQSIDLIHSNTNNNNTCTTTIALRKLHTTIRESSIQYYRQQARRTKDKLLRLATTCIYTTPTNDDNNYYNTTNNKRYMNNNNNNTSIGIQPYNTFVIQLSPIMIRYCYKVAIYYEIIHKYDKSLQFYIEAYKLVYKYYQWLLLVSSSSSFTSNNTTVTATTTKVSSTVHPPSTSIPASTTTSFDGTNTIGRSHELNPTTTPRTESLRYDNHGTSSSSSLYTTTTATVDSASEVEVELAQISVSSAPDTPATSSNTTTTSWTDYIPNPPDDIMYQCREVADWLNYKILYISFVSNTEMGYITASYQWRQHTRMFATRQYTSKIIPTIDDWMDWSYISRQRIIMCSLLEQYPPKFTFNDNILINECMIRCSPWRSYLSTTEALLCLAHAMDEVDARGKYNNPNHEYSSQQIQPPPTRARYIGCLVTDDSTTSIRFQKERAILHREKALEYIIKAIHLFEGELMENKRGFYAEDEAIEKVSSRTGARLYYIAGGILLGMKKYDDAAKYLMKASRHCKGWRQLELPVRRLLTECYEHCIPTYNDDTKRNENSENIVSIILNSYFNADLSSQNLRKALKHLASVSGGKNLQWYQETCDEEDTSLPFTFTVNFPGKTQARSGDTVAASVVITSNLNYAVFVNAVALGTLAGKLLVPSQDLLCATNASDGSNGGIIIQANTSIVVTTKVVLPNDLSAIAFDESGNGGELLGVAGKGSFAKIAKPRTAGITAAGGARLVSEELLQRGNNYSQGWNLRFLGGKPLLCEGLHLTFYPVQAEAASAESVTPIELTIQKKKVKTAANIKRTPFEEENYIASAWSRPHHLPFSRGPRSLRVLGPQPELVVSNITEDATKGKALEGTVNRVLLKLQAGLYENCIDLNINISCFSVLITPNGATKRLVTKEELSSSPENSLDMSDSSFRVPTLVVKEGTTSEPKTTHASDIGYELPTGWTFAGTGQRYTETKEDLKGGDSSFVQLDFYRPAAYSQKTLLLNDNFDDESCLGEVSLCKTDFYITITYKQERSSNEKPIQRRQRRTSRALPVMNSTNKENKSVPSSTQQTTEKSDNDTSSDIVSLDFSGSILWAPPITASFTRGAQTGYSCGMRHPALSINNAYLPNGRENNFILTNGETLSTRCCLQLDTSMDAIQTEIVSVRFENNLPIANPVSTSFISTSSISDGIDCIYKPKTDDPSRLLRDGTKMCVSYTIQATIKDETSNSATDTLGCILVDWRPSKLESSYYGTNTNVTAKSTQDSVKLLHGPLPLETPSTIRFTGPECYIERAPFTIVLNDVPSRIVVAEPFDIQYTIENTTKYHQSISIEIIDESESNDVTTNSNSNSSNTGLMLSGCTKGRVTLSPYEKYALSYNAIAFRPGDVLVPIVCVSSDRYKSWIINDRYNTARKSIFVLP